VWNNKQLFANEAASRRVVEVVQSGLATSLDHIPNSVGR